MTVETRTTFHPKLQTPLSQSPPTCLHALPQFPYLLIYPKPTIIWLSTCDCTKLILTKFINDQTGYFSSLSYFRWISQRIIWNADHWLLKIFWPLALVVHLVPNFPFLFLLSMSGDQLLLNANVPQVLALESFFFAFSLCNSSTHKVSIMGDNPNRSQMRTPDTDRIQIPQHGLAWSGFCLYLLPHPLPLSFFRL